MPMRWIFFWQLTFSFPFPPFNKNIFNTMRTISKKEPLHLLEQVPRYLLFLMNGFMDSSSGGKDEDYIVTELFMMVNGLMEGRMGKD